MFKTPTFKVVSASLLSEPLSGSFLFLTHPKRGLPAAIAKKIVPARLAKHGALLGVRGAKLALYQGDATVLVMGIGEVESFSTQEAAEWAENAGHALLATKVERVQLVLPDEMRDPEVVFNFLKGLCMANYRLDEFKTKKSEGPTELKEVSVSGAAALALAQQTFERVSAITEGIAFARDLVELPSATASPKGIVDRFKKAVGSRRLSLEVWDEKKIAVKKMGLLQAVSQGSGTPPRFLIARYTGAKRSGTKTLFLVGKGVTFDTGGVNLKTVAWRELIGMKKDMGGAAGVLGAMLAIARLKPSINVVGVTPLTTNQLSAGALHPGDIFRSFSGKTVEIQNTDAEGRLVLADAVHYAVTQKADWIVDAATLTGACCVALGAHLSGLFSNHSGFSDQVRRAAEASGEPTWALPMSPRYGDELKSQLADLSNMGKSRDGGATTGAKFIEKFVAGTPWVHLDIAGTVDLGEPAASAAQVPAAGRMVHTFVTLAEELSR
ncbi:leucyl aminopeptidase family protein [Bdellovibrionota bacterium FG-1]